MNSSPVVISYLTRFYWENRCLQILSNTVALNSYLGFSALSKKIFLICIKLDLVKFYTNPKNLFAERGKA